VRIDVHDGDTSGDTVGFTVLSSKTSSLYYSNNWKWDNATLSWKTVSEGVTPGTAVSIQ